MKTPCFYHENTIHSQKIDSSVSVVSSSSAFIPITELPFSLSRGLHTATE